MSEFGKALSERRLVRLLPGLSICASGSRFRLWIIARDYGRRLWQTTAAANHRATARTVTRGQQFRGLSGVWDWNSGNGRGRLPTRNRAGGELLVPGCRPGGARTSWSPVMLGAGTSKRLLNSRLDIAFRLAANGCQFRNHQVPSALEHSLFTK
jgi:hypothetical protein